ncbi:hypothetical protein JMJ77_0012850 [Colletotrichum scovillei]|uniref:Secreted protein n=1 Tax=Colletotrichum scovillei TaxID=1209932 RepID=A0A9P7R7P3_9PEZI|nr:hypothetical protein JMJ77_0012850 [Colletotrichum scovillei]KAG7069133.1 hypothetical protein JMJ76_0002809 [Colletotrichum scovillei]KAG7073086.1 hypothetical protein JMJ78_0014067 [Colletotrichum scovillei]
MTPMMTKLPIAVLVAWDLLKTNLPSPPTTSIAPWNTSVMRLTRPVKKPMMVLKMVCRTW